jgi:multicomponent Na+:H+ antiporter subunit G
MTPIEALALGTLLAGLGFFVAGTVGMLRFPDVFSRLHALTKADNLGLALIAVGTAMLVADVSVTLKLLLIWFFVALASATSGHLIARHALRSDPGS